MMRDGASVTMPQSGKHRTRGNYGEDVRTLTAVMWSSELDRWVVASPEDHTAGRTVWAAWDSDFGWMAPWEPEASNE